MTHVVGHAAVAGLQMLGGVDVSQMIGTDTQERYIPRHGKIGRSEEVFNANVQSTAMFISKLCKVEI